MRLILNESDPVPLFCAATILKTPYLTRQILQRQNVFAFVRYEFYLRARRFSCILKHSCLEYFRSYSICLDGSSMYFTLLQFPYMEGLRKSLKRQST